MRSRKNQEDLTSSRWDCLIEAMKELKKCKGKQDWDYFVDLHHKYGEHNQHSSGDVHALPHLNGQDLNIHSAYYWLAWHRKFILEFETRLRHFEKSVTIPYWDWITYRKIPVNLKKKLFGWMKVSRAVSHKASGLPSSREFRAVTGATNYQSFDAELSEHHATVHNWVGGAMRNPGKSPKDPLFFLHHAFIDQVWAEWQTANPTLSFPSEYLDFTLPPWNCKVRDVLDIKRLGYRYV